MNDLKNTPVQTIATYVELTKKLAGAPSIADIGVISAAFADHIAKRGVIEDEIALIQDALYGAPIRAAPGTEPAWRLAVEKLMRQWIVT